MTARADFQTASMTRTPSSAVEDASLLGPLQDGAPADEPGAGRRGPSDGRSTSSTPLDSQLPDNRVDLRSLDLSDLEAFVAPLGKARYRARQLFKWLYHRDASSFDEMTDLSKDFRAQLALIGTLGRMDPHTVLRSTDGTRKCLFLLEDGLEIESVVIPEENRLTICISTQVGCSLACSFCVTGLGGVKRNLKVSEIVGQLQGAARHLDPGERLTNIVVMGMGEPLLNYDNVVKALRIALNEEGLNFSHRRVTLSTAGVVPNIYRLARDLPVNLAVSLNATTEALRSEIMPVTRRYSMQELLEACRHYPLQHNKRITFEYVLLAGLNDSLEDAARLCQLLKGIKAKVNLIPYNENAWSGYKTPDYESVKAFQNYLVNRHMHAAVRWSRGPDIGAACGQLGVSRVRVERFAEVDTELALD